MVFCICHPRSQVLSRKKEDVGWLVFEAKDMDAFIKWFTLFISLSTDLLFRDYLGNLPIELCLLQFLIYHDFSQIAIHLHLTQFECSSVG